MIRQLQNAGPTVKIILGALLVLICASMAITLIPGGIGSSFGIGAPPAGVLATIGDQQVTVAEVLDSQSTVTDTEFAGGVASPCSSVARPKVMEPAIIGNGSSKAATKVSIRIFIEPPFGVVIWLTAQPGEASATARSCEVLTPSKAISAPKQKRPKTQHSTSFVPTESSDACNILQPSVENCSLRQ